VLSLLPFDTTCGPQNRLLPSAASQSLQLKAWNSAGNTVFRGVTPCGLLNGYLNSGGTCYLLFNILVQICPKRQYISHFTASYAGRL